VKLLQEFGYDVGCIGGGIIMKTDNILCEEIRVFHPDGKNGLHSLLPCGPETRRAKCPLHPKIPSTALCLQAARS
jgi:hypothetical protein